MSIIKYTSTLLKGTGKEGVLTPNDNGEYQFCVGALNIKNSIGAHYALEGSRDLFEKSSAFMHRVRNGGLYAENGHPVKSATASNQEYLRRIHEIRESRTCAFISELWLDHDMLSDTGAVAIMATIKPHGELKGVLESAIANPKQNVCFSVRGFTKNVNKGGVEHRTLTNIITFDYVGMPGIAVANKSNSPSLEDMYCKSFDTTAMEYDNVTSGDMVDIEQDTVATEADNLVQETLNYYKDENVQPRGGIFG